MVLSSTKKTSSMSSITNTPTGGGSKKAGFPNMVGISSSMTIAFNTRGLPLPLSNWRTNRSKRFPSMNLPQGFTAPIKMR